MFACPGLIFYTVCSVPWLNGNLALAEKCSGPLRFRLRQVLLYNLSWPCRPEPSSDRTVPAALWLFAVLWSSGIKLSASHYICVFLQTKRLNLVGLLLGLVYLNTRLMARYPDASGEVLLPTTSFKDTHRTAGWVGFIAGPSVWEKITIHCPCLEPYNVFWIAQPPSLSHDTNWAILAPNKPRIK